MLYALKFRLKIYIEKHFDMKLMIE